MNGVLLDLLEASQQRPIEASALGLSRRTSLIDALRGRDRLSLLAEFKRRSPSEPLLASDAQLLPQLRRYTEAGAAAVSVLTEPTRFGGSLRDLRAAVTVGCLPVLRKDFLVRPEQVRESASAGASAVLLIARCLPGAQLAEMVDAAQVARVEVLLECHDEHDLERALPFEDVAIGINNRDLDTLHIDRATTPRLARGIPKHRVVVAESGYDAPEQLTALHDLVDAVLIGSALMRGQGPSDFVEGAA